MQSLRSGLVALAFAGMLGTVNSAKADIIDAPSSTDKFEVINAGNVMKDYSDSSLKTVDNTTPSGNTSRKYYKSTLNPDEPILTNHYSSISGSSQKVALETQWFLPDGFNLDQDQHGNFQSVALDDDNNIYFVESMGSKTNRGSIAKFNLTKLKELGVDTDTWAIWNAYSYFDPYTTTGMEHNRQYNEYYQEMKTPAKKVKSYTDAINRNKEWRNNQVNYKANAAKWYKHWKAKKANIVKKAKKAKKPYSVYKNYKSYKTSVSKMAKWMSSYKYHGNKIKNYDKKIANYTKQMDTYQKQVDEVKAKNPDMFKYVDIAQTAQLSPIIDIGHGQTLSFNPENKHMYLAEDNTLSDLPVDQNNEVMELDTNTLQPVREYKFKMLHNNSNMQLHTLAFDSQGNAYWGRKKGSGYMIFYGRLDEYGVNFAPSKRIIGKRGGDANQFLSVNPKNDRIYFVSDDIFTSIPTEDIRKGTTTADDIHYQAFKSLREFEGLAFDQDGYGYLLALWPAELLKSTKPLN
ncbi:hypothetical protein [Lentilactobacillus laojiaonis]|uniref:hypothetical protein n=1 Tax=Lentilactobacillus laojiaonis TaxID=2883998 RepID=UPI001D0AEC7F|nr:hypothetical protein [Lentilactobacillus laojiaonis]UDM32048.1 hypothetical protein LHL71_05840 [Lentilactobacillus laojiaonis]